MAGITKDVTLVLDGQQRITSLLIGLKGSYRYFYYRWRKTRLYLNLLKPPTPNEDNPEELTYGFAFRESSDPWGEAPQLWYPVGRILDFEDAEDAKADMRPKLAELSEDQRDNANKLIGRLHNRIHTTLVGNYYQEKSQDYDKVLQVFVRANSAGQPLEYSDLLLATAPAKWETLDARSEIHEFTDSLNDTGTGYGYGKDFVLKASLYLTENLPIQYKVKNFSRSNLRKIEANWGNIKEALATTVRLISRFGFNSKNVVAPLALLPIALYLLKRGNRAFDTSSKAEDAEAQVAIRRWFVFSTLKNAFGGSSDTTLNRLRELLKDTGPDTPFPAETLYRSLGIEPRLSDAEIERILGYALPGPLHEFGPLAPLPRPGLEGRRVPRGPHLPAVRVQRPWTEEAQVRRENDRVLLGPLQHALQPPVAHRLGKPVEERHALRGLAPHEGRRLPQATPDPQPAELQLRLVRGLCQRPYRHDRGGAEGAERVVARRRRIARRGQLG
ncbi:MAG: DUF262 domain-containing protein [Gemmataceae bacterium]|nr:DUF262 domain-containing protein [Gemmataceae bacterium]